jgi:hypothetical protein
VRVIYGCIPVKSSIAVAGALGMVMARIVRAWRWSALRMSHCAVTEEGQLELHTYFGRCTRNLCLLFPCVLALSLFNRDMANMKSFLSLLLLGLVGLVQALSSTGNRLLVVLEEASDKSKYSSFFGDLECELCLGMSVARFRTD